jgi:hypothetical protein
MTVLRLFLLEAAVFGALASVHLAQRVRGPQHQDGCPALRANVVYNRNIPKIRQINW